MKPRTALATKRTGSAVTQPPDLGPLIEAQIGAARFYVLLTLIYICFGLGLLACPMLVQMSQEGLKLAMRIGGGVVTALGAFPSSKYLQRKDRESALRMISHEYGRLSDSGFLASPAREELDKIVNSFLMGMIK